MTHTEKLAAVLNDLVRINNDRIKGYETAAEDVEKYDVDLKAVFNNMADQSRSNVSALQNEITRLGQEAETGGSIPGAIHRAWIDTKAVFTGNDREAILNSCEFGEDAILKAYNDALATDADLDVETRQMITSQRASLKNSHDAIKKMRDVQEAVS